MRRVEAGERAEVTVEIDGRRETASVDARTNLADFARGVGATSVRVGCEQGVCGSCTVMLDDMSVRSCLVLAVQADGSRVETLAGIGGRIDELRAAFARHFALQCGFCASGILVTAAEWLAGDPVVDEAEVRRMLSANVCRCTGYEGMVRAILEVASSGT